MEEFYTKINNLVQDLLIPVRTEKKVNMQVFEEFYNILVELEEKVRGEECIPRRIAGLLFFIYTSLASEVEGCDYKDELFIAVAKVEDMLDRILWDSPFK